MIEHSKIINTIINLEKKYDLFLINDNNIYIWKIIRMAIVNYIVSKNNSIDSIHGEVPFKNKLLSIPSLVFNSFFNNPFIHKHNTSKLVIENPRKIYSDSMLIDPYTHFFLMKNDSFSVIEGRYKRIRMKSNFVPSSSSDFLTLSTYLHKKVNGIFNKNNFSKETKNLLKVVEDEIEKELKIRPPLIDLAIKKYNNYISTYKVYNLLFKQKNWKEMYLVCSYDKEAIISAAQDNGLKVIEFQHGVINNFHLGYNFPYNNECVPYFPDKLLMFGYYWKDVISLPRNTETEIYGYPYLEQKLEKFKNKEKYKKQVLFLSQGTIGKELSKFAKGVAEQMPDYNFIYKLHPAEFNRWKDEYSDLVEAQKLPNFKVIDNNNVNLYHWFAVSEFQVGVYSTAVFEGLTLSCKTVLVNLQGIEYVQDLIDEEYVLLAKDIAELKHNLENHQVKDFGKDYFFKKMTIN